MFATIEEAIEEIKKGKMLIVVDDEDRENEGDLLMAAEAVTDKDINFMATFGRGLICMPLSKKLADKLDLPPMTSVNTDAMCTAFTVSIDAVEGTTTGISAEERAVTIRKAVADNTKPSDFRRPGHIFPLVAKEGGVLRRAGHTEAAVDLAEMAGFKPAGVICEIMNDDGTMARLPQLKEYAKKHNLKIITIAELIAFRKKRERLVDLMSQAKMPTKFGEFTIYAFEDRVEKKCHVAIVKGDVKNQDVVPVRVHSECLTGDVLSSLRCDCGNQLEKALTYIEKNGYGVVLYLRQEGRGIGLANKIKAYNLQDQGYDTVEANEQLGFAADLRDYGLGAQILEDLGLSKVVLMTNNPKKLKGLEGYGIEIVGRIPVVTECNPHNEYYLETKCSKLGHMIKEEN